METISSLDIWNIRKYAYWLNKSLKQVFLQKQEKISYSIVLHLKINKNRIRNLLKVFLKSKVLLTILCLPITQSSISKYISYTASQIEMYHNPVVRSCLSEEKYILSESIGLKLTARCGKKDPCKELVHLVNIRSFWDIAEIQFGTKHCTNNHV